MQQPVDKTPSAQEVEIFSLTGILKHMMSFVCSYVIFSGKESKHCDKKDVERGTCCSACWARRSAEQLLPKVEKLIKAFHASHALMDASTSLVRKLDVVHASPEYLAVWSLAANHLAVGDYKGPQYDKEFKQLREIAETFQNLINDLDIGVVT